MSFSDQSLEILVVGWDDMDEIWTICTTSRKAAKSKLYASTWVLSFCIVCPAVRLPARLARTLALKLGDQESTLPLSQTVSLTESPVI